MPDAGLALVATLELDALRDRLLAALTAATDAQGGALWIADGSGTLVLQGRRGLVRDEALPARVDPRGGALAEVLARGAPAPLPGFDAGEALLVPLRFAGALFGVVLLERSARGAFQPRQRAAAADLAPFAAVAVRNAVLFGALERRGLRDAATGAYRLDAFSDHAAKELSTSRRYGRSFSVAVLTLDGAGSRPPEALRAAARGVAAATARVVRDGDVLARASDREHRVLLPDTDRFGARMFARRAAAELAREPALREAGEPQPVAIGVATFPHDGDGLDALLAACRARQEEQRASLLGAMPGSLRDGDAGFWELVDALLDGATPTGAASARLPPDPDLLDAVQREAAREIRRDPRARGMLLVARPGGAAAALAADLPRLESAMRVGDAGWRVYAFGPRLAAGAGGEVPKHPLLTPVFVDGDRRFDAHAFVILLSEAASYALLQTDGALFHTSDAALVDTLAARLQARHDLPSP
jgi:GGDEF domain-containing protein